MAYITQTYITERVDDNKLVRWTAEEGSSSIDSTVIDNAITDAESMVDSKLSRRYTVPLTGDDITDLLKKLTFDIAIYYVHTHRFEEALPIYEKGYKDAINMLDAIRDGKQDLQGVDATALTSDTEVIHTNVSSTTREFTKSNFDSYGPFESL